ncbi:hypothetical protein LA080_004482 [Diaporthe eres]|nr:hypothetical protein LA080_004482 [Diaporthe eres]
MAGHIRKLLNLVSWSSAHMGGCRGNAQVKVGQIAQTTLVTAGDFKGHPDERSTTMRLEQDAGNTFKPSAIPRGFTKPRARLSRLMNDRGARQDLGRLGGPKERGYDRRAREIYARLAHGRSTPDGSLKDGSGYDPQRESLIVGG